MIKNLLDSVRDDFETHKTESHWVADTIMPSDINALREQATEQLVWDISKIRLTLWEKWLKKETTLKAFSCEYGRVIVLGSSEPPSSWIRIFRLLKTTQKIRIIWFASEEKRLAPPVAKQQGEQGAPILPTHVNGGYAQKCNPGSIVIFRKEEATRVLIHELLHASCTDPITELPQVEADTEAWAEVILVAIASKGEQRIFDKLWSIQATYAIKQSASARKFHQVRSSDDYGWRYITGRLDCFKTLGLILPVEPKTITHVKSLRLTDERLEP